MSSENVSDWIDVKVACGPYAVALWGVNGYVISVNPIADYAACLDAARDIYGKVAAPLAIYATNAVALKTRRGVPQLTAMDAWTLLDRITAESYASSQRTVVELAAYLLPQPEGLRQAFGEDTADETYLLVCTADGVCTVLADINEDGDATPDLPAGGLWQFRTGGLGGFDAAGPGNRTYTLPVGTLIEAQDVGAETPTLSARTVAQKHFDDVYPYPVVDAAIGILGRDAKGNEVLRTGTKTDSDGPFGGRVVFIGQELGFPAGGAFHGGDASTGVQAEIARPATPLLDDDGIAVGFFFVGVEAVAVQCRRHSGWITQADIYSAGVNGDIEFLLTQNEFTQAEDIGAVGPANVDSYPDQGHYATGARFYQGNFFPPSSDRPSRGGYAPCGTFCDLLAYNSDWPRGYAAGGSIFTSMADPHQGLIQVANTYATVGGLSIVDNSFQWVETIWRFRGVYIERTTPGIAPSFQGGDTRGKGGRLYYSAWSAEKSFTYCPATCSAVFIASQTHNAVTKHETRTVYRYGYELVGYGANAALQRKKYYNPVPPYIPTSEIEVVLTGVMNDGVVTCEFDAIPGCDHYSAAVNRERGNQSGNSGIGCPPGPDERRHQVLSRSEQLSLESITPGGTIAIDGAEFIGISVVAINTPYANGSRNVGPQCAPQANHNDYTGDAQFGAAPYFGTGERQIGRYGIAGFGVVTLNPYSGWNGEGAEPEGSKAGYDPVLGYYTGGDTDVTWTAGTYCYGYTPPPTDYNSPPPTREYYQIKNPGGEDGSNMYPYPAGRPKGISLYDPLFNTEPAPRVNPILLGCHTGDPPRRHYWRGHVRLWIGKQGQDEPKYVAQPLRFVKMLDGTKAYYADVTQRPGFQFGQDYKGVVGYQTRYDMPLSEKDERWLNVLALIARYTGTQEDRDRIERFQRAQTHIYFEPLHYEGPFLCYINSDSNVFQDDTSITGYVTFLQDLQLFEGVFPGESNSDLPDPIIVGAVSAPTGLLGSATVGGVDFDIYDRPQFKD